MTEQADLERLFDAEQRAKLAAFAELRTPLWVVDVEAASLVWANDAALASWNATSLSEVRNREAMPVSRSAPHPWSFRDGRPARLVEGVADATKDGNAFIDLLLEHLPNMVFVKEAEDLRFVHLNRAAEALLGYGREELLGKNDHDFFPKEQADFFTRKDREVLRQGDVVDIPEEPIETRDFGKRWLHTKKIPIRDASGEPAYLLGLSEDITGVRSQKLELEAATRDLGASEGRFRTICEHAPVMINSFTADGRCTLWNRECEARLGWTFAELAAMKQPLAEVYPVGRRDGRARGADEANGAFVESQIRAKDGEVRVQLWADLALPSGELISVGHDITERKEAERKLAEQATELERSNQALEAFAYVASHDLQEPLRMVASYVALLQKRYAGQLDERADKYISYAVEGATRMHSLLESILDFSRVGRSTIKFDNIALANCVMAALEGVGTAPDQLSVTVGDLPTVWGDADQLVRVFQNLIWNAVKFRATAPAQVDIQAERDGPFWRVSVRDNGVGFEAGHAKRIFEMFHRLHERGAYEGSGIGLAVVAKIVELHGGRVWATGNPGAGATVFFTVPAAKP